MYQKYIEKKAIFQVFKIYCKKSYFLSFKIHCKKYYFLNQFLCLQNTMQKKLFFRSSKYTVTKAIF